MANWWDVPAPDPLTQPASAGASLLPPPASGLPGVQDNPYLKSALSRYQQMRDQSRASLAAPPVAAPVVPSAPPAKFAFDLGNVGNALWEGATQQFVPGVKSALAQAYVGLDRPDTNPDWANRWMAEGNQAQQQAQAKTQQLQQAGKSDSTSESIREAVPSLGFSIGSLASGLATAAPVAAMTGGLATIPAIGASMIGSGVAGYRMAGAQYLNDTFNELNKASVEKRGRALDEAEKQRAYEVLKPIAEHTGLWEAGPEAIGNAATIGLGGVALGFLGKEALAKISTSAIKQAGMRAAAGAAEVGTELGTETVTQIPQGNDQAKADAMATALHQGKSLETALTEGQNAAPQYEGAAGALQAFKDIAPQTLATIAMMGTGAKATHLAYRPIQQRAESKAAGEQATQHAELAKAALADLDEAQLSTAADNARQALAKNPKMPTRTRQQLEAVIGNLDTDLQARAKGDTLRGVLDDPTQLQGVRGQAALAGMADESRVGQLSDEELQRAATLAATLANTDAQDQGMREQFAKVASAYEGTLKARAQMANLDDAVRADPSLAGGLSGRIARAAQGNIQQGITPEYARATLDDAELTRHLAAADGLLTRHADSMDDAQTESLTHARDALLMEREHRATQPDWQEQNAEIIKNNDPNEVRFRSAFSENPEKTIAGLSESQLPLLDSLIASLDSRAQNYARTGYEAPESIARPLALLQARKAELAATPVAPATQEASPAPIDVPIPGPRTSSSSVPSLSEALNATPTGSDPLADWIAQQSGAPTPRPSSPRTEGIAARSRPALPGRETKVRPGDVSGQEELSRLLGPAPALPAGPVAPTAQGDQSLQDLLAAPSNAGAVASSPTAAQGPIAEPVAPAPRVKLTQEEIKARQGQRNRAAPPTVLPAPTTESVSPPPLEGMPDEKGKAEAEALLKNQQNPPASPEAGTTPEPLREDLKGTGKQRTLVALKESAQNMDEMNALLSSYQKGEVDKSTFMAQLTDRVAQGVLSKDQLISATRGARKANRLDYDDIGKILRDAENKQRETSNAKNEAPSLKLKSTSEKIISFVRRVLGKDASAPNELRVDVNINPNRRDLILKATGVDIGDPKEVVLKDVVAHIHKGHPAMTEADWQQFPIVANDFHEAYLGKPEGDPKTQRIVLVLRNPGQPYVYVAELARGKQRGDRMFVKTFFKDKAEAIDGYLKQKTIKGGAVTVEDSTQPASSARHGQPPSDSTIPPTEKPGKAEPAADESPLLSSYTRDELAARQAAKEKAAAEQAAAEQAAKDNAFDQKAAADEAGKNFSLSGSDRPADVAMGKGQEDLLAEMKSPAYGANNKLVSTERANVLREKLRAKLNQLNAGIDPELLAMGTELAVYHLEAGVRKFADFTQAMIGELGDAARPYLRSWYEGARYFPEFDAQGMTDAAGIDAAANAAPVELDMFGEPIPAQNAAIDLPVVNLPVSELKLSNDVPQFKSGANSKNGVVEPLGGTFDPIGVAPIQVWKRLNGDLEVISGRHRLDLAQRSGRTTIAAQVHNEADGFDAKKAGILDAELNIRDGQGKVKDYVDYFIQSGISKAEADLRGLVSRFIGKTAFAIANDGSAELIAAHRANALSDEAAVSIAGAAPGNSRLQAVGIKSVLSGKSIVQAVNLIHAVKALASERGAADSTGDMFGLDDSAMKEAEAMAKIATRNQRQFSERLAAIQGAAKRPELARKEGVDVKNPKALAAKIAVIKSEKEAWDSWPTNPALIAQIREELNSSGQKAPEAARKEYNQPSSSQEVKEGSHEVQSPSRNVASKRATHAQKSGDLLASSPVSGQLDIFAPTADAEHRQAQSATVNLGTRVESVQSGMLDTGITQVLSPEEAAHVLASLSEEAQEHMLALVTDDAGHILSVIRHTIGTTNSSQVEVSILLGVVHAVPGAANVWFAHNHPSGTNTQSSADISITNLLTDNLRGTGIRSEGMIVITSNHEANYYASGMGASRPKSIPSFPRIHRVAETTRKIRQSTQHPVINHRETLLQQMELHSGGKEGVLLLSNSNRPVAFVPMVSVDMINLRNGKSKGAALLYQAIHESNANQFAVKIGDKSNAKKVLLNLSQFAYRNNLGLIDSVIGDGTFQADRPQDNRDTFFARASTPATLTANLKALAGDTLVQDLLDNGRLNLVARQDQLPPRIKIPAGERVAGAIDPETGGVYLVAENIRPDEVSGFLTHEIGVHQAQLGLNQPKSQGLRLAHAVLRLVGARQVLGEASFADVLKQLERMRATGHTGVKVAFAQAEAAMKALDQNPALLQEEALAYLVQNHPQLPLVKRIIAAVRAFLYRSGFKMNLTENDVQALAVSALRSAARQDSGMRGKVSQGAMGRNPDIRYAASLGHSEPNLTADELLTRIEAGEDVTPDQWAQVQAYLRSAAQPASSGNTLKDWFGKSKIKSKDGQPLTMYHGTATSFNAFDAQRSGSSTTHPTAALGFFFTNNRAHAAEKYAGTGGKVLEVYLAVEKPYSMTDADLRSISGTEDAVAFRKKLEAQGYDGVILPREAGKTVYVAAFRPDQVKLTRNETFTKGEADMRFARAYTADQEAAMDKIGKRSPKTWGERFAGLTDRVGLKLRQAVADHHAALLALDQQAYGAGVIENDIAASSWVKARLSRSVDGPMNVLLHEAALTMDAEGALDVIRGSKGLQQIFEPLGSEADDFLKWVAGWRADRLKKEDRERLFTDADIDALKALNKGTMADGRARSGVYGKALREFAALQKSVMDIAEQAGLIDGKERSVWERDFYVPFYRLAEDTQDTRAINAGDGMVRQEAFKRLKGGKDRLNDLLENTVMNWHHLLSASLKNSAARQALTNAQRVTYDGAKVAEPINPNKESTKGAVYYRQDGKPLWFRVNDPLVLEAITALDFSGLKGPVMALMRKARHILTRTTTISPAFKVANLLRDTVQTLAVSKASAKTGGLGNIVQGWQNYAADSEIRQSLLAGGGAFRFGSTLEDNANALRKLLTKGVRPETILDTPKKLWDVLSLAYWKWEDLGDRLENVNRAALYTQLRDQGKSHLYASFQARDLLDFSQSGASGAVRLLTAVVPFLNARIQGLDKLGRAASQPAQRGRFAVTIAATTLASALLYFLFKDDKDFKEREEWDRDTYWWFKLGGVVFHIPKPFEVGAIASLLGDRVMEQLMDKEANAGLYLDRLKYTLTQTFSISGPQLLMPAVDVWRNKASFTQRPIETMAQQRLSPQMRQTARTSDTARAVSAVSGGFVSPLQADYLIGGYFGWLGRQATLMADYVTRPLTDRPTPDRVPLISDLIQRFVPTEQGGSSKYLTRFYQVAKESEQRYADIRELLRRGDAEGARTLAQRYPEVLIRLKAYRAASAQLNDWNNQLRMIADLPASKISDSQRTTARDTLQQLKVRLARGLMEGQEAP